MGQKNVIHDEVIKEGVNSLSFDLFSMLYQRNMVSLEYAINNNYSCNLEMGFDSADPKLYTQDFIIGFRKYLKTKKDTRLFVGTYLNHFILFEKKAIFELGLNLGMRYFITESIIVETNMVGGFSRPKTIINPRSQKAVYIADSVFYSTKNSASDFNPFSERVTLAGPFVFRIEFKTGFTF